MVNLQHIHIVIELINHKPRITPPEHYISVVSNDFMYVYVYDFMYVAAGRQSFWNQYNKEPVQISTILETWSIREM